MITLAVVVSENATRYSSSKQRLTKATNIDPRIISDISRDSVFKLAKVVYLPDHCFSFGHTWSPEVDTFCDHDIAVALVGPSRLEQSDNHDFMLRTLKGNARLDVPDTVALYYDDVPDLYDINQEGYWAGSIDTKDYSSISSPVFAVPKPGNADKLFDPIKDSGVAEDPTKILQTALSIWLDEILVE